MNNKRMIYSTGHAAWILAGWTDEGSFVTGSQVIQPTTIATIPKNWIQQGLHQPNDLVRFVDDKQIYTIVSGHYNVGRKLMVYDIAGAFTRYYPVEEKDLVRVCGNQNEYLRIGRQP